jgi:hypothetical protein
VPLLGPLVVSYAWALALASVDDVWHHAMSDGTGHLPPRIRHRAGLLVGLVGLVGLARRPCWPPGGLENDTDFLVPLPPRRRKSNWLQQWLGWGGGDSAAAQDPAFDPAGWWPETGAEGARQGARPQGAAGVGAPPETPSGMGPGQYGGERGGGYRMRRARQQHRPFAEGEPLQDVLAAPGTLGGGADGAGGSGGSGGGRPEQRDIITGEPLNEAGEVVRDYPLPGEGAQLARDYRMQPVRQMAKWVFGEEGGPPPKK